MDHMEADELVPQKKLTAYAVNRSQNYPPEWVKLGPVTELKNGHITGRFISTPTSAWGWEWLAVPDGETPPPLAQDRPPKRPAQQSRPAPVKPVRESPPLPGEDEDEARGFFSGDDEPS
jgi:hypothetical protein